MVALEGKTLLYVLVLATEDPQGWANAHWELC
jgi:hypothetical protein